MNRLLISSLFKLDTVGYTNKLRDPDAMTREALKEIRTRAPFKLRMCNCLTGRTSTSRLEKIAESSISKELDLIRFIRR